MSKPERFVFVSDSHGHHVDPHAAAVFFEFLKEWKPTFRAHLGDAFDFAALRRGASDAEKREPLHDDIDAGCDFLRRLKPSLYLDGNHEVRLADLLAGDDEKLSDYASSVSDRIKDAAGDAIRLPYCKRRGIFQYGDTRLLHGYGHGIYAARQAAMAYGKCCMGHVHSIDAASAPRMEHAVGRTIGAMCKLLQPYNRAHLSTLRQAVGFAFGVKLPSGVCVIYQAESHDGLWVLPTAVSTIKARAS